MTGNVYYDNYIAKKRGQYGDKFDDSELNPEFIPYYHTEQRVEVQWGSEKVRGFIGATTGWRPCFLILRTKRSISSCYTIGKDDKILRVITSY